MKNGLIVLVALTVLVACAPKVVETVTTTEPSGNETNTDILSPVTMSEDAAAGEVLYNAKCTKCHGAKIVDNYTKERWDVVLPKMIDKAKLNETDAAKVSAFVEWELNN